MPQPPHSGTPLPPPVSVPESVDSTPRPTVTISGRRAPSAEPESMSGRWQLSYSPPSLPPLPGPGALRDLERRDLDRRIREVYRNVHPQYYVPPEDMPMPQVSSSPPRPSRVPRYELYYEDEPPRLPTTPRTTCTLCQMRASKSGIGKIVSLARECCCHGRLVTV